MTGGDVSWVLATRALLLWQCSLCDEILTDLLFSLLDELTKSVQLLMSFKSQPKNPSGRMVGGSLYAPPLALGKSLTNVWLFACFVNLNIAPRQGALSACLLVLDI